MHHYKSWQRFHFFHKLTFKIYDLFQYLWQRLLNNIKGHKKKGNEQMNEQRKKQETKYNINCIIPQHKLDPPHDLISTIKDPENFVTNVRHVLIGIYD